MIARLRETTPIPKRRFRLCCPRLRINGRDTIDLRSVVNGLPKNSRVLEIGTGIGGSAIFFARHNNVDEVITIDSFNGDPYDFTANRKETENNLKHYPQIRLLVMTSEEAFKDESLKDFDMIYIDGDHRYPAVKFDGEAWQTRLKPNGYLVGHDYAEGGGKHPGVERAIKEILPKIYKSHNNHQGGILYLPPSTVWCNKTIGRLTKRIQGS